MKKGLRSVCAITAAVSILLAALTACGEKMDRNNSAASADSQTTAVNINNYVSNNDQNTVNPSSGSDSVNVNSYDSGSNSSGSSSGVLSNSSSSGNSGSHSNNGSSGNNGGGSSTNTSPSSNPDRNTNSDKPTEPSTTRYVYDIKKIVNNAPLNPMRTNDAELDERIDNIFAEIITEDMSTYEKTRAIFDYLVQTNNYGYLVSRSTETSYVSIYDRDVVTRAKTILKNKRGTCIDFAAAFMCMTRRIGLNCYMVTGQITDRTGATYYHGWNTLRVDGIDYTFDSQADFRRAEGGPTKFVNFGTYYPDVFRVEYINLAEKSFKKFRTF